jgi:hypothetical protein
MESTKLYDVMVDRKIAERAYYKWEHRGRPFGSPDLDWYQAVEEDKHERECRGLARE